MTESNLQDKTPESNNAYLKHDKIDVKQLKLSQSIKVLELMRNIQNFNSDGKVNSLIVPQKKELDFTDCYFFKVNSLSYDEEYPHREAFENVIMALDNEAYSFVYLLEGTKKGVELYLGVIKNSKINTKNKLTAADYGKLILKIFEGNFNGSTLKPLEQNDIEKIIIERTKYFADAQNSDANEIIAGLIVGIPSVNEKETGETKDFQGMDRLINSMIGINNWRLVIICEPLPTKDIIKMQMEIYNLYNRLHVSSKLTKQKSFNDGTTVTFGKNTSESRSENTGTQESKSEARTQGEQTKHSNNSTTGTDTYSSSKNITVSKNLGDNSTVGINKGSTDAVTIEMANKHAIEIMKYIDEELLERVKSGITKGLYNTSVFYMADRPAYASRLKNAVISLFQGNKSSYSPLIAKEFKAGDIKAGILGYFQNLKERADAQNISNDISLLYGRPFGNGEIGLSSLLTLKEVSLLAGFPQQEVPGLKLKEEVNFGLNVNPVKESIMLGNIVQKGRELQDVPFALNKNSIKKHIFIAGVTGSGKTTTCQKLLKEAGKDIPFLVIEPAKTEYRALIKHDEDITVFTLGNETVAPFRLNPFEIVEGENISSHIDMLKATFTASFPMEGSMPQMLEEAIYLSYQKKGWDVENNQHSEVDDTLNSNVSYYPVISDLLNNMKEVVKEKHFGDRMENEYLGSLISRLSNLTVGAKGRMLNCERSMDFNYLADHKVILEMEDLKNPEDKSLFMGFILSRLAAVIKNKSKHDRTYKHVTLIEEAHRLLSKVEYGDSGSKKSSVETFTDLLAEVRKYGEGLIIVDQIPNKLAPDVLKNTNTKIVHRIFARDDKEVIGDTMMMDDKQKEFLSSLLNGHVIVFAENTDKPIHVAIKATSDTSADEISEEEVRKRFILKRKNFGDNVYGYGGFLHNVNNELAGVFKKSNGVMFNRKRFNTLKQKIDAALQEHGEAENRKEETVWLDLVTLYYSRSGKGDACGPGRREYEKELADIFRNKCINPQFEAELKENPKLRLKIKRLL